MALGFIQSVTERVPGIFLEDEALPARKADNLTAICETII
jgi:hypothetical protein